MKKLLGYVTIFVLGFGACAAILTVSGASRYNGGASSQGRETIQKALSQTSGMTTALVHSSAVADAAAKVEPAVVNIDIAGREARGPFGFFGGEYQRIQGSGSGIIISADGYVVTNNHVVEPVADENGSISITLDNGKEFSGRSVRIVGRDPRSDLAVLKISGATGLPAAALGDSDKLRVGDWAIAIGNPLGFNSTVTLGIISALNRRNFMAENTALDKVIQTDASINPGNSGGALADISGRVIGINTAIASPTGSTVGIGFAIPITPARAIIKDLVEKGKVVRPYLGVMYSPLAQVDRDGLRDQHPGVVLPDDNQGAIVVNPDRGGQAVVPGSPADKAGLRAYDVIRKVGGRTVDTIDVVKDEVQKRRVGEKLPVTVWRAGRTLDLEVTLEEMPGNFDMAPRGSNRFAPPPDR